MQLLPSALSPSLGFAAVPWGLLSTSAAIGKCVLVWWPLLDAEALCTSFGGASSLPGAVPCYVLGASAVLGAATCRVSFLGVCRSNRQAEVALLEAVEHGPQWKALLIACVVKFLKSRV